MSRSRNLLRQKERLGGYGKGGVLTIMANSERRPGENQARRKPKDLGNRDAGFINFDVLPSGRLRFTGGHPSDSLLGVRRGEPISGIGRKRKNSNQGSW